MWTGDLPTVTAHAQARWHERFPGRSLYDSWLRATRIGKRTKKKLAKKCPKSMESTKYNGYYYRKGPNNEIFVVTAPETIVTVFPL